VRARIALNALALRPGGSGVQTYIRELLRELVGVVDAELVAAVQSDAVGELPPGATPRAFPVAAGVRRAVAALRMPGPFDLVHGLDATLPVRARVPTVATFHDLAVFDVPSTYSRRRAAGKRLQLRHAARTADVIISVSEFTADRLRARLRRESVVIPEAPPPDCAPPSSEEIERVRRLFALPAQFVLSIGTVEPRKDVSGLAAACKQAGLPLVHAGARPARSVTDLRANMIGHVPRADLIALYGAATIVAFASWYEGFGLPPIEAMACGAPVVTTSVASLSEMLGDAAVFVPMRDVDRMAAALRSVWDDDAWRTELSAAGRAQVRTLHWGRAAEETAGVYRSLGLAV
jgi:glycosyltransferase involved in cell wall biosynthesis